MDGQRVFKMPFANVYPLHVQKAEEKGRKKSERIEEIENPLMQDTRRP